MMRSCVYCFICTFLCACIENLQIDKSDLMKYDYLAPFFQDSEVPNIDGRHEVDTGLLEISYFLSHSKVKEEILRFDSIRIAHCWTLIRRTDTSLSIAKVVSVLPHDSSEVIVRIRSSSLSGRISITVN